MSNALAIAAVTKTLYNLLHNEFAINPSQDPLTGVNVTMQPPDAANSETSPFQVNLFLYHVMPNAAWRNMPLPNHVLPGETGQPPLALNLYYMITTYARENSGTGDIDSHNLLGRVMRILYDHPVLSAAEIQAAMQESDLQNQIERIRITMQPLNIEEIYRLWTGFQTQYRLSVSYEAAVVLIESTRAVSRPLPVLQIGRDGLGATVVPDRFPYPVLFSAQVKNIVLPAPPGNFGSPDVSGTPPIALQGDTLIIQGHLLSGPAVHVVFASLQSQSPPPISLGKHSGDSIEITIPPDTSGQWPYGYYMLTVQIDQLPPSPTSPQFPPQNTNSLVVALAPQIDPKTRPVALKKANGDINLTLKSVQKVLVGQKVSLLLNDQEIPSDPRAADTNALSCTGPIIEQSKKPATYTLRLRVDGVDSIPFNRPINPQQPWDPFKNPPQFDSNQQVTI
ncbi:MAG TPA: DUF4255 domain-containing protein [Ktedonobacteraceae bacterium]|nr:DUF4255 domain-containing protein [Ktedonobacteraceae bacterium]